MVQGPGAGELARFVLIDPEAHEVFVAGSFNNWHPGAWPLVDRGHGHWVKEISLAPGRYEYQFVVDGRWMHDRNAEELVENPFGGMNSVLVIAAPQFKADDDEANLERQGIAARAR